MKNFIKRSKKIILRSILAAGLGLSLSAQAIVYTASNESTGNRVIAYDINKWGRLQEIGSFPTGGTGTGAPLGNQAALATDASDRWLFVTNSGDGTLTSFRILERGLEFVNRVPTIPDILPPGRPISVAVFGTLVYVLNEGIATTTGGNESDTISGFRFTAGGVLVPIPFSTRFLSPDVPATTRSPAQIGFNKSGTVLLITEKATNSIATYVMQPDGTPANTPLRRPSAVPTPFGFQFGDRDFVYITEANGGGQGVTASYRVDRETGAVSSVVDTIAQGNATCWTVLSNDQTVGYSTNTGSGTVSLYRVNFNGTMDYFFHRNTDTPIPSGAGVRDAVLTQNNEFLVTLNNGASQIRGFWVNRSGSIWPRSVLPIPASATGLVAR